MQCLTFSIQAYSLWDSVYFDNYERRFNHVKKCIVVAMKGQLTVDAERSLYLIQKGTIFVTKMLEISYNSVNMG